MTQGKETGLSTTSELPIRRHVLDGALKVGQWNFGILRRNFLIRRISHEVSRESLPIARPIDAEPAITVINEKG